MASFLDIFRRKTDIKAASPENPSTSLNNPDSWLLDWAGAGPVYGSPVTEKTAMTVSAVFRCVSLLSGAIATLPLGIYRDDPRLGRVASPDHRLASLFTLAPFPGRPMTSFIWKEITAANILLEGNSYNAIRYDGAARVVGFEWIDPHLVEVTRKNGRNLYTFNWPHQAKEVLDHEDVLHYPGIGWDGIVGMSRIRFNARNAIALNRTLEAAAGLAHENAVNPSAVFELPQGITPDSIKRFAAHITSRYAGRNNTRKPLFMDAGTKITSMDIPLADLTTITALRFSIGDISRFFGVPIALLNETEGTTAWGTGVDSLIRGFLRFTLDTDLSRIEAEINNKLFSTGEFYAMFDRDALLVMDPVQSSQAMSQEINAGVMTINEARQRRHRPLVTGGDEPLVNSTLVPLNQALAPPAPPPSVPTQENTTNDPSSTP